MNKIDITKLVNFDTNLWADIKVIVGLGNPLPQYAETRHNAGAIVVSILADKLNLHFKRRNNYEIASGRIETADGEREVALVIPLTFMNNSGELFLPLMHFLHITPENILVIHDDLEKKVSTFGFKFAGSDRGHNGLRSIISAIGENFYRLRIGIGRPLPEVPVSNYVLEPFSDEELFCLEVFSNQFFNFLKGED